MLRLSRLSIALLIGSLLAPVPAAAAGCAAGDFGPGSGDGQTSGAAYVVSTRAQLEKIVDCTSPGNYFKLSNDISLGGSSQPWTPLGTSAAPFEGNFDGANFTISGLNVSATVAGLFAYLGSSAQIENLVLEGTTKGVTVGALAGIAYSGANVTSVSTTVDVVGDGTTGNSYVGGLIGFIYGVADNSTSLSVLENISILRENNRGSLRGKTMFMGGVVGLAGVRPNNARGGYLDINHALVDAPIVLGSGTSAGVFRVGGVIGSGTNVAISQSRVTSTIQSFQSSSNNGYLAGIAGQIWFGKISNSSFRGAIFAEQAEFVTGIVSNFRTTDASGLRRFSGSSTELVLNYVNGALVGLGTTKVTGIVGYLNGDTATYPTMRALYSNAILEAGQSSNRGLFGYKTFLLNFTSACPTAVSSNFLGDKDAAAGLTKEIIETQDCSGSDKTASEMSSLATFTNKSYSITTSESVSHEWVMCDVPRLAWETDLGCNPTVVGVGISLAGNIANLYLSSRASSSPSLSFDRLSFSPEIGLTSGNFSLSSNGRQASIGIPTQTLPLNATFASYAQPTSPLGLYGFSSGLPVSNLSDALVLTSRLSAGPVASIGNFLANGITGASAVLECQGSCSSSDPYSFEYKLSLRGNQVSTDSGSGVGASTLNFNNLTPGETYVLEVRVTKGVETSDWTFASLTIPRPVATISSLVVTETTATLNVGCTNCGAAPDSFTISATPQAGGAAITSNTAVLTGLSAETTYSFAVVVAYAGTSSASVNWQGNPVRTNPYSPVITSITPSSGPLAGGVITVTGSNFSTSNQVTFGGSTVSFSILNSTTITFTAPAGSAGVVSLAVRNPAGTGTLPNAFTYVASPTLTAISPALATTNGGTIVTLTGTELASATQVNLGSSTVSVTVVSSTKVQFVTPATSAGVVDVGIVTIGGVATLSQALEFTTSALVPVITSITPTSGTTAGGTTITVTGQYFSGSYSNSVSAAINGVSGSSVVVIDDSTLTFVSPAGLAASGLDVSVTTDGGVGVIAGAFTYIAPPAPINSGAPSPGLATSYPPEILEFSTRTVSVKGGTVVVTGKRLEGIQRLSIGGIDVVISSNTDTSLTFVMQTMPVGTWDLVLINGYGKLTFLQALTVEAEVVVIEKVPGKLLGWRWTPSFEANLRTLTQTQRRTLDEMMTAVDQPQTIVCWGYTTSSTPNSWALEHARTRAQAACDYVSKTLNVKAVVRIRTGVIKAHAMRTSIQFWK